MKITVNIPTMLRYQTDGSAAIKLEATTVAECLVEIERDFPGLYQSICNDTGNVRPHVNLFINDAVIPKHTKLGIALSPDDTVYIMPSVSGG